MAFCTECGKENRQGARFCRFCGTPMDEPWDETTGNANLINVVSHTEQPAVDEIPNVDLEEPPIPTETGQAASSLEGEPENPGLTLESPESTLVDDHDTNLSAAMTESPVEETPPDELTPVVVSQETLEQSVAPSSPDVSVTESPVVANLEPLPVGTLIQGRFQVINGALESDGTILYEVEDALRCWNCQAVQSQNDAHFCEVCGAELTKKAVVRLQASMLSDVEIPGDEAGRKPVDWFVEGEVAFHVLLSTPSSRKAEPVYLRLVSGYLSDPGKTRGNNEDSLIVFQLAGLCELGCPGAANSDEMSEAGMGADPDSPISNIGLFAVSDGVGGYAAGEVASQATVRSLANSLLREVFISYLNNQHFTDQELEQKLKDAVLAANQAVMEMRIQSPEKSDMGSTLTAVLVMDSKAFLANVGDSRTYLMRQGKLSPISRDHSLVATLVEQGTIKPEEVYSHEQRNIIYRSLGDKLDLIVDTQIFELEAGDRLLLCSDGLWEMVRDPYIEDILLERLDPQQACQQLVDAANMAGGEDNISAVVVNVDNLAVKGL
jgi:serine/threonine protein phosphatase PrpC